MCCAVPCRVVSCRAMSCCLSVVVSWIVIVVLLVVCLLCAGKNDIASTTVQKKKRYPTPDTQHAAKIYLHYGFKYCKNLFCKKNYRNNDYDFLNSKKNAAVASVIISDRMYARNQSAKCGLVWTGAVLCWWVWHGIKWWCDKCAYDDGQSARIECVCAWGLCGWPRVFVPPMTPAKHTQRKYSHVADIRAEPDRRLCRLKTPKKRSDRQLLNVMDSTCLRFIRAFLLCPHFRSSEEHSKSVCAELYFSNCAVVFSRCMRLSLQRSSLCTVCTPQLIHNSLPLQS